MRFRTALIAAFVAAVSCLYPGIVSGQVMFATLIGAGVGFTLAYITYSYHDVINDSPIDKGSIISGNLAGVFFSAILVSNGYWQVFWLTGTAVTLAMILGALWVFFAARLLTGSNREAAELAESMLRPSSRRKDDDS